MTALSAYSWPGNVREMKNCIERAVILSDGELIRTAHLRLGGEPPRTSIAESSDEIRLSMTFDRHRFSLDAVVDRVLEIFLDKCGNNKARAAKLLGVNRKMFYRRKFSQTE
jgi:DNA-binding NtrC family response regulator